MENVRRNIYNLNVDHDNCICMIMIIKILYFYTQELPQRMTTAEEKEILSLLCKVHELEIDKVSFREAIVSVKHYLGKPSL